MRRKLRFSMKKHSEKDKHLENVVNARRDYYDAQRRFRESVIQAREQGHSLRRIAEMAGVSNVTVLNWSKRETPK